MAYLTTSNALRMVKGIDLEQFSNINKSVYKKPIYCFSKYELNLLSGLQMFWSDPKEFINSYYIPVSNDDKHKYIFEGGRPAYHQNCNCERLTASFNNFLIPVEIKERGEVEIQKFRSWFKLNMHLLEEKQDVFMMRMALHFKLTVKPQEVSAPNSGIAKLEVYNLPELESRIDAIIRDCGRFWHNNTDKQAVIRRFSKYTFLGYKTEEINNNDTGLSDKELKEFLVLYDKKFKRPLKNLLIEYYRIKFNPDLNFKTGLLEQLGFVKCQKCHNGFNLQKELDEAINPISPYDYLDNMENLDNNLKEDKELLNQLIW